MPIPNNTDHSEDTHHMCCNYQADKTAVDIEVDKTPFRSWNISAEGQDKFDYSGSHFLDAGDTIPLLDTR